MGRGGKVQGHTHFIYNSVVCCMALKILHCRIIASIRSNRKVSETCRLGARDNLLLGSYQRNSRGRDDSGNRSRPSAGSPVSMKRMALANRSRYALGSTTLLSLHDGPD